MSVNPTKPARVFVYGTLMPGERNEQVARRHGFPTAQPATLYGYRLFHLTPENYPGIVPGEQLDRVHGYLLTYQDDTWEKVLPLLDELEGLDETPPLYTRAHVQLELDAHGKKESAWVYVYARAERLQAPGVQSIPGGDWRETQAREQHGPDER